MTTTTTAAAFKYYHHSLITLSHPLRLRPLLLQTHATRSSFLPQPTEPTFPSNEGNFTYTTIPTQLATLLFSNLPPFSFQTSRHLFKPTAGGEGGHVTKKVEGVILLLRKSLPPLDWTPPLYYWGGKVRNKQGNVLCHAAFHRMMGSRCFVSIQGNGGRNKQYHFP